MPGDSEPQPSQGTPGSQARVLGPTLDEEMVPSISPDLTLVIRIKQGPQTQRSTEARRSLNELRDLGWGAGVRPHPPPSKEPP